MVHFKKRQLIQQFFILFVVFAVGVFMVLEYFLLKKWFLFEVILSVNISSFAMFGYDKVVSSYEKSTRLPEIFFYIISALGGSLGILIGSNMFRHKTQKLSFMGRVLLIIIVQAGLIYVFMNTHM